MKVVEVSFVSSVIETLIFLKNKVKLRVGKRVGQIPSSFCHIGGRLEHIDEAQLEKNFIKKKRR